MNMNKNKKIVLSIGIVLVLGILIAIVVFFSGDSDSEESQEGKLRRSSTTTTMRVETTTSGAPTESTLPIDEVAFISGAQLGDAWPQAKLCALVSPQQAQEILSMTTLPEPKYAFREQIGARCSYTSGAGDEIYIEISNVSYKQSREIDTSLNAVGDPIVVSGVAGVTKVNALGAFFELNINGAESNQWVVYGPAKTQAQNTAEALIESLT